MNWLERWRPRRNELSVEDESHDPELARLLERASDLPKSQEPRRDLFRGIENRIGQAEQQPSTSRWSLATLFPRPLAAAGVAALLVAMTAVGVLWVVQPLGAPSSDLEMAAIAERLRARDGVAGVHQSVVAILEARRADLAPETVAAVEENLRSIDRAIAEIHLALESNPNHHRLNFLLAEAYGREADLLERLEWWTRSVGEAQS